MNDKKSIYAIVLSILVVMVYSEIFIAPKARQAATNTKTSPSTAATPNSVAPQGQSSALIPSVPSNAPSITAAKSKNTPTQYRTIETPLLKVTISNIGGRVTGLQLKKYKHTLSDDAPLDLVTVSGELPKPLGIYLGTTSDADFEYTFESDNQQIAQGGQGQIVLATTVNGARLTKSFTLNGTDYFIGVELGGDALKSSETVWLEWTAMLPKEGVKQPQLLGFSTLSGDNVQHTILPSLKNPGLISHDNLTWAAFSDQYFLTALVGHSSGAGRIGKINIDGSDMFVTQLSASTTAPNFSIYAGPKDYQLLKGLGNNLYRTVDLGFFSFLAQPLLWLLRALNSILHNWGLSIIALTLLLKAAFLPLTKASFTSMKAMQEIAPEVKALRERISDPTQLNQEMLALYKRRGVNPLGGCLPMLIQIPVFLGLYNALLHTIELRHAPFALWIHDLSAPEWLSLGPVSIPVLVVLMTALMVIQQILTPSPDPTQKKMMVVMSLVFSFIFINFPAGLTLYWLVNSLISVVQQKVITKGSKISPTLATAVGSFVIFGGAFILTKL